MSELLLKIKAVEPEQYDGEVVLKDLQHAVKGLIEVVYLKDAIMIVNQEGVMHDLPYNILASSITGFPIVGNAALLTNESVRKFK